MAREKPAQEARIVKPDMAKIGPSTGTKGEVMLLKWFRWRRGTRANDRRVTGTPDLTFYIRGTLYAVFVDGRFWHDPRYAALRYRPHHTTDWVAKAKRNRRRDRRVDRALLKEGAVVIRIWDECFSGKARSTKTKTRVTAVILKAKAGEKFTLSKARTDKNRGGIYEKSNADRARRARNAKRRMQRRRKLKVRRRRARN